MIQSYLILGRSAVLPFRSGALIALLVLPGVQVRPVGAAVVAIHALVSSSFAFLLMLAFKWFFKVVDDHTAKNGFEFWLSLFTSSTFSTNGAPSVSGKSRHRRQPNKATAAMIIMGSSLKVTAGK